MAQTTELNNIKMISNGKPSFLMDLWTAPITGAVAFGERFVPLRGENMNQALRRFNARDDGTRQVRTSNILRTYKLKASCAAVVETRNTNYVCIQSVSYEGEKQAYLAIADYVPEIGTSMNAWRRQDEGFVEVCTSEVIAIRRITEDVYEVETRNSFYYTCVL